MKLSDGVEAAIHCVTSLASLKPDETISAADLATVFMAYRRPISSSI